MEPSIISTSIPKERYVKYFPNVASNTGIKVRETQYWSSVNSEAANATSTKVIGTSGISIGISIYALGRVYARISLSSGERKPGTYPPALHKIP